MEENTKIESKWDQGKKFDDGKVRLDLLSPVAIWALAKVLTHGAGTYGDRNWEQGIKYSRVFGAMLRHAWKWWWGETHCPKDGQHHLASVLACAMFLIHYDLHHQKYEQFDDRVRDYKSWEELEALMYSSKGESHG